MKKVITLSLMSLFASVTVVAQSSSTESKAELKKEVVIRPLVKIDKAKMKQVVKMSNQNINSTVQPVKKEEEVKSIETNQK